MILLRTIFRKQRDSKLCSQNERDTQAYKKNNKNHTGTYGRKSYFNPLEGVTNIKSIKENPFTVPYLYCMHMLHIYVEYTTEDSQVFARRLETCCME